MTPKEFAKRLDGRAYPFSLSKQEKEAAVEAELYVLVGYSDYLVEVHGAEREELDGLDGITVLFDPVERKLLVSECEFDDCPYFQPLRDRAVEVRATYSDRDGWRFCTDIPHSTFDVLEDEDDEDSVICRGVVFDRDAIATAANYQATGAGA